MSCQTVWRWKQRFGVPRLTEGGKRLSRELLPRSIHSPAAKAKSRIASHAPELMAKRSSDRKGKPLSPQAYTAKARAKARRSWRKHARENSRAQAEGIRRAIREGRFKPHGPGRPWTAKEMFLLGTTYDHVVAKMIGRTRAAVATMRAKLGVPMSTHARRKMQVHTAERNAQIRQEHREGARTKDLATRYRLCLSRIEQIVYRGY